MRISFFILFIVLSHISLCQTDTIELRKLKQIKNSIDPDSKQEAIKPCSTFISCFHECFDSLLHKTLPSTETIEYSNLERKKIKECNLKLKKYYQKNKNNTSFNGIAIDNIIGPHNIKVLTYYDIRDGIICTKKILKFLNVKNKIIEYSTLSEKNIKDGTESIWFPNGIIKSKTFYKDGLKTDTVIEWYPNGKLKSKILYNLGEKTNTFNEWYSNGNLTIKSIHNSVKNSDTVSIWYPNGKQKSKTIYCYGKKTDTATIWYSNGHVKSITIYQDGEKKDTAITWNSRGKVIYKYDYTNKKKLFRYDDTIYFKNLFSIDLVPLFFNGYSVSYERMIFKRKSIKLKVAYMSHNSDSTSFEDNEILFYYPNKVTTDKYISLAYISYYKSNFSKNLYMYYSAELYYIDKSYKNKYILNNKIYNNQHTNYIDKTIYNTYFQSEYFKIYGIDFQIGIKSLLFKPTNKLNLLLNIYSGFGFRLIDDKIIRYSECTMEFFSVPFTTYPEPKIIHTFYLFPTINFGFNIGVTWKCK